MSASSSVISGSTAIQRNSFNLEYYKQFGEIFDEYEFRVPEDVETQLSAKERSILQKLNRMELGKEL